MRMERETRLELATPSLAISSQLYKPLPTIRLPDSRYELLIVRVRAAGQ